MEKPAYQTNEAIETLIEETTTQRAELLAEAERSTQDLTPELVHSLGERAFQLANSPYTYPAQAEYFMSKLAAVTQSAEILDLAHKTIHKQFSTQTSEVRSSSHWNANETTRLVSEGVPVDIAGHQAMSNVFESTYGISLDDALLKDERINPATDTVSQIEAYNEWMSAESQLHSGNTTDEIVRQIVEEGLVEVAELVAAQVIPEEELSEIHLPTPTEVVQHRQPQAVDLFVLAQTVNEIKKSQPNAALPLKLAVRHIAKRLPEDVIPVVKEELTAVYSGSTTSTEVVRRLSTTSPVPIPIAA